MELNFHQLTLVSKQIVPNGTRNLITILSKPHSGDLLITVGFPSMGGQAANGLGAISIYGL